MAYTLQSLITILEKILNPEQTLWIVDHNKPQLESLLQKATSLEQILHRSPLTKIEFLESQIRDAAHEAEDIIESHMVDQMLSNPEAMGLTFSTPDLQPVMHQLDSATEQVEMLVEETGSSRGAPSSRNVDSVRSKALVGVDGDLEQLRDRLTGDMRRQLEIVPIVGMGGIGKTTLARELYEDPSIVSHFKSARAWATISQDYDMKAILLSLLHCIRGNEYEYPAGKEIHELKPILHQSLYGVRYMIVLDDVWSSKFWDEIRMFLPDNNERSRIVITTRESEVANHASSQSVQHQMQLLDEFESWKLLRQEVFGDQDCPLFLQGIGEKISRDCGGLPLAINVIGGLLSKVERSIGVWESIAKNVASAIVEADEQFSNIFSLSYRHLPNHLKPCFLYMGAFPKDHRIESSKLVLWWIAEGFVKSNGNRSLEEEAEGCLKALVERNLIFVAQYEHAKPKHYGMHDLLRDLCITKSNEERFLYVVNGRVSNPRTMRVAESFEDNVTEECIPLVRSLITIGKIIIELESFRLVRVLDVMDFKFDEFPTEILQLVNLRFLAVWCKREIPHGISRLKNLQTLIAETYYYLTSEIFAMSELRHLQLTGKFEILGRKTIALNKLQTVSLIRITRSLIRRGFLESIPDIKHLAFRYKYADLALDAVDLTHLHKLETLTIYPNDEEAPDRLSIFAFPSSLRKLVVHNHVMFPSVMTTLCALPNLEVLGMYRCEFVREGDDDDEEWEVAKGDTFRSLQVLHIEFSKLVRWRAEETHFPRLRHLHLYECRRLEEIPSGIGEISTLQLIELRFCSSSAVASAIQIVEEQQTVYDNHTLQLRTDDDDGDDDDGGGGGEEWEVAATDYGNYTLQLRIID